MLAADVALLALIGALLLVAYLVFLRLTNSSATITWTVRTLQPEPPSEDWTRLKFERDEARRAAEALRAELEARGDL